MFGSPLTKAHSVAVAGTGKLCFVTDNPHITSDHIGGIVDDDFFRSPSWEPILEGMAAFRRAGGQISFMMQVDAEAAGHTPWVNQTLTHVDDAVVRLGVLDGEFHWHKHDAEDEYFQVLEGELLVDIRGEPGADTLAEGGAAERTLALGPGRAVLVPRGVVHRTRAAVRTVVLMIEGAGVVPTGDA